MLMAVTPDTIILPRRQIVQAYGRLIRRQSFRAVITGCDSVEVFGRLRGIIFPYNASPVAVFVTVYSYVSRPTSGAAAAGNTPAIP